MKTHTKAILTIGSDAEYSEGWVGHYSCELGVEADGNSIATLRIMNATVEGDRSAMLANIDRLTNALIRLRLKVLEADAQDEAEQAKAAEAARVAFAGVIDDVQASNG